MEFIAFIFEVFTWFLVLQIKREINLKLINLAVGDGGSILWPISVAQEMTFTKKSIKDIFKGKYPIKDFVTSKTIKDMNKYKTTVKKDNKGKAVLDMDGNEQNIIKPYKVNIKFYLIFMDCRKITHKMTTEIIS